MNWKTKSLDELCEIINGFAFKSKNYVEKGVRVIRITNVQKGSIIDDDPKFHLHDSTYSKYELSSGDLLISLTGNVGRVGILDQALLPAYLNQRVACIRPNEKVLLTKYLFYFLNSDKFEFDSVKNASGVAQKNMSTRWLAKYKIPLPPLKVQQQIVEILDEADALRKKREKSLSMVSELSKPIFQKMFGSIHNPPSKFNRLPVGKLLLESPQNGIYKPQTEYGDGTAIIRIETYNSGDIITDKTEFRFVKLSRSEVDKYKVSNNDILVNRVNSPSHLGKVTLVRNLSNPTVFESNMMKIRLNPEKINPKFGFINLTMPYVKRQILNLSRDAVNQSSINQSDVRSVELIVPSQEEQKNFVDLVEEIIRQLDVQNKQKTILEDLYSSLLQKAFSGEIKIN